MTNATQPAKSKTLLKREVIALLGKSKRRIETYISEGRLPATYFNGPNGKQAVFQRSDVERLKAEMDTPMVRALPAAPESSSDRPALTPLTTTNRTGFEDFARLLESVLFARHAEVKEPEAKQWAPWLTLSQASEYSGLPAAYLLEQARSGQLRALNVGAGTKQFWRFHRDSLAK